MSELPGQACELHLQSAHSAVRGTAGPQATSCPFPAVARHSPGPTAHPSLGAACERRAWLCCRSDQRETGRAEQAAQARSAHPRERSATGGNSFVCCSSLKSSHFRKCDVLNRGFSGYNTRWAKIILPRLIRKGSILDSPVVVTIFFGANDSALKGKDGSHLPRSSSCDSERCCMLCFPVSELTKFPEC